MLSEEENFNALPFGGHAGELLPAAAAVTERAPPPQPLQIEPPPWAGQMGDVAIVQPELPAPTALAVMKLQGGDIEEPPPPPLRAPLVMPPLVRPQLPEPDWRAEEQERLARKRMQPATDEPAKSLQGRPLSLRVLGELVTASGGIHGAISRLTRVISGRRSSIESGRSIPTSCAMCTARYLPAARPSAAEASGFSARAAGNGRSKPRRGENTRG